MPARRPLAVGHLLPLLAVIAAGCKESPVSPPGTPSVAVPSGLAAVLTITPASAANVSAPAVTVVGDSVVATAVLARACANIEARAGRDGGALVLTVVSTPANIGCVMMLTFATFRVAVPAAPRGRYDVVFRDRSELSTVSEQEIVRRTVVVP